MPLILLGRRIQILMEKSGDLPTYHSHPHLIGIINWTFLFAVTSNWRQNMTKKFISTLILLVIINYNAIADIPEILIKPNNEEYTRLSAGLAGSNITIISSETILSKPNDNIHQILEDFSGIEVRKYYDGVENVKSEIDMRGFGEAAKSNSLILLNGNRLNSIDMSFVDLSNIPLESIERIEIIRGGSGSTLYGSGAIGGTINIVTKNSVDQASFKSSYGSYSALSGELFLSRPINKNDSVLFSSKLVESDTYRNSADYSNESFLLNFSKTQNNVKINLDVLSSDTENGLPGARVIGGVYNYHFCNLYSDSKTARNAGGYSTFDHPSGSAEGLKGDICNTSKRENYANTEKNSYNSSILYSLNELNTFSFNFGYKDKIERSFFAANANTVDVPNNGDRYSVTEVDGNMFNLGYETSQVEDTYINNIKIGFDHNHTFYNSNRHRKEDEPVGHFYDADIKSQGYYFQNTTYIPQLSTSISFGARSEDNYFSGRDTVNRNVNGFASKYSAQNHSTYNNKTSNTAFNFGVDSRIDKNLTLYGSYSTAFRIPNIDERILTINYPMTAEDGDFILKDQESNGYEFGIRYQNTSTSINISVFEMDTKNEIQYNQAVNANLDPIKREGLNLDVMNNLDSKTTISGSISYVSAEFTAGTLSLGTGYSFGYPQGNDTYGYLSETAIQYLGSNSTPNQTFSLAGKKVPLVAPLKAKASITREMSNGFDLKVDLHYVDERYVSNDQENIEPMIPDYYLLDLQLSSENGPYNFDFGVNNLLNKEYYDFAISSTFHDDNHYGTQNVYPLPERNLYVNFGYKF